MISLRKLLHQKYLREGQVLVKLMFKYLKVQKHPDKIQFTHMRLSQSTIKNILDQQTKTNIS